MSSVGSISSASQMREDDGEGRSVGAVFEDVEMRHAEAGGVGELVLLHPSTLAGAADRLAEQHRFSFFLTSSRHPLAS